MKRSNSDSCDTVYPPLNDAPSQRPARPRLPR